MTTTFENETEHAPGVNGSAPSSNGSKPSAPPSLEDFFLHSEKGAPNILQEMITTSVNAQEFIPRAIVSKREAAAMQRFSTTCQIWKDRIVDPGLMLWGKLAFSIAIDGRGRNQAVTMYSGLSGRIREGFMGMGMPGGNSEPRQRR